LPVVAAILLVGIAAQVVANKLRIPSVVFYLLAGVVMGPQVLGLVTLETFGGGLEPIVGLAVAIIVFDGAFALKFDRIQEAETTSLRFVTIGAALTLVGTATAVRFLEGVEWELALLIGALLVATGPTVITPILEVVRVREHVAAALETEGIINDVTAAIAAVVIFETALLDDVGVPATLLSFLQRFGVGIGAGLLAATLIYVLADREVTAQEAPQAARFLLLSAAVWAIALAKVVATEAGIAAAATAGIALGNLELPPHGDGRIRPRRDADFAGLRVHLAGSADRRGGDHRTRRRRAPAGGGRDGGHSARRRVHRDRRRRAVHEGRATVPRGDGPTGNHPRQRSDAICHRTGTGRQRGGGQILLGTVFIVIFATDLIEAGFARQIGDRLGVTPMRTIIIGGGRVGRALATRLERRGEFVVIVESDERTRHRAREDGFTVEDGDGTEAAVLREAGIEEAKIVVAATSDDDINLLVCQTARTTFGVEDLYARVNDPEKMEAFESLSVTAIDSPTATAFAIDNEIERPELAHWMQEVGDGHDIQEIELTAEDLAGKTIREVNADIPSGVIVAEVGQGDDAHLPEADDVIESGDHLTFLGDVKGVERAVKRFHPHD
jgi:Trk K+ transport system NAD-binding subunit